MSVGAAEGEPAWRRGSGLPNPGEGEAEAGEVVAGC
jgi:hypothetical protein